MGCPQNLLDNPFLSSVAGAIVIFTRYASEDTHLKMRILQTIKKVARKDNLFFFYSVNNIGTSSDRYMRQLRHV